MECLRRRRGYRAACAGRGKQLQSHGLPRIASRATRSACAVEGAAVGACLDRMPGKQQIARGAGVGRVDVNGPLRTHTFTQPACDAVRGVEGENCTACVFCERQCAAWATRGTHAMSAASGVHLHRRHHVGMHAAAPAGGQAYQGIPAQILFRLPVATVAQRRRGGVGDRRCLQRLAGAGHQMAQETTPGNRCLAEGARQSGRAQPSRQQFGCQLRLTMGRYACGREPGRYRCERVCRSMAVAGAVRGTTLAPAVVEQLDAFIIGRHPGKQVAGGDSAEAGYPHCALATQASRHHPAIDPNAGVTLR